MAFSVSVRCLPGREASEYWHVDMVPWSGRLRDDPRFRAVPEDESGMYEDFYAVLTVREALAINAPELAGELWHLRERAEQLREFLTDKTPSGLVVVHMYEWESGLGD